MPEWSQEPAGKQRTDLAIRDSAPPLTVRTAHEIPKPKDWQALQRGCVILFQAELKDAHAQEYGRNGQYQSGIDVLGRRNGDPEHFVGVQCRLIEKPLKKSKILSDCRDALRIKAGLKEIIFATTAPNDTGSTDAAIEVEKELRAEGHDIRVVVYGWADLQLKIALHETAYNFFFPAAVASSVPQVLARQDLETLSVSVVDAVVARLQQSSQPAVPTDVQASASTGEDPALHAKIDVFRDLFRTHGLFIPAKEGLSALLSTANIVGKPWAKFRIESNLGSIAISLGRHDEAVTHFENAYEAKPADCNAIANLALARTIQGRYAEAMALAETALNAKPRSEQAVSFLLQAAARSSWQGDPEELIPTDLAGNVHADMGLAEFLRKRDVPGWARKTRELARRHPNVTEFRRADAIAVLALAIDSDGFLNVRDDITAEDIDHSATEISKLAEQCLTNGFADRHDLMSFVNNAALLLRLANRQADCERLLVRAIPLLTDHPPLRRLLALSQVAQGRFDDAEATLRNDTTAESQLLAAELTARRDVKEALAIAQRIDTASQDVHVSELKWRILGELSLKLREYEAVESAISGLKSLPAAGLLADLLELRRDAQLGADEMVRHTRLRQLGASSGALANTLSRYLLADEMRNQGIPADAIPLLEPMADLQRLGPATRLYILCLAEARRDETLQIALAGASATVREDPEILWLVATHSWNTGDLATSRKAVDSLLASQPDNPSARLLKIELLIRSDNITDLLQDLDRPIERLSFTRLSERFRVALLLGHFGHTQRAAAYAYRLFLENKNNSQAWLTFSGLFLTDGVDADSTEKAWDVRTVCTNAAVDAEYDDGEKLFVVVEPDAELRKIDSESWEPDHPLARHMMGLAVGDQFTNPTDGRSATIRQIRHKYVARLHYVLSNHEARFPDVAAFRSLAIDTSHPDGLAPLVEQLKARHDWFEQEQAAYRNGPWPLSLLAHRLGHDTIDTAEGLAAQNLQLKVAFGSEPERLAAVSAISENGAAGCVMDLLSFWTCWRLGALGVVSDTGGTIHLAQSCVDQLRQRRERISQMARRGSRSARYDSGKMVVTEIAPEIVQGWLLDTDAALQWIQANAIVCPLIASENIPAALRDYLSDSPTTIFDSLVLSMQKDRLLISDDLPTRNFGRLFGFDRSAWLQQVFSVAVNRNKIEFRTCVEWTAHLINAGHNYIGISGAILSQSAAMDAEAGQCPGYFFNQMSRMIGGAAAEPISHVRTVVHFLRVLWSTGSTKKYRESVTGALLQQLICERTADYRSILKLVIGSVKDSPLLTDYMATWLRGHFLQLTAN